MNDPTPSKGLLLTSQEVVELTGRTRRSAQREVLLHLCVPFKIRPDGSIVILRSALEVALGYTPPKLK